MDGEWHLPPGSLSDSKLKACGVEPAAFNEFLSARFTPSDVWFPHALHGFMGWTLRKLFRSSEACELEDLLKVDHHRLGLTSEAAEAFREHLKFVMKHCPEMAGNCDDTFYEVVLLEWYNAEMAPT